ncbi:MAG: IS5 family transposase [Bergeyella sp.]
MKKNTSQFSKSNDLFEIIKEISSHLTLGDKKNNAKVRVEQIVEAILYRLKTGCQWRELPTKQFFYVEYSWNSVYQHFARWSKEKVWDKVKEEIFEKYKMHLDLSSIQLDGSQSLAKRGGESVGYQFRRKGTTSNMLFLCDNQGFPLSCSDVIPGNHHDVYDVENQLDKMLAEIRKSNIRTEGLFLNADAGFDAENLRNYCVANEIFANIDFNKRNGNISDREEILDKELYKRRFVIERMNAWIDGFKALLIRYETKTQHWRHLHIIAFCCILIRKL